MPAPKIARTPVESLQPWAENPRTIDTARLEDLKRALHEDPGMLQVRPLVARPDGTVIMGNQRLLAARELGWTHVPCVRVDVDDATAKVWALRDNSPYGDWDHQALQRLLRDLADADVDLQLTGFAAGELEQLLCDDVLPPPEDAEPPRTEQHGIIILCRDAQHQQEVYDLLHAEGSDVAVRLAAVEVRVVNT